MRLRRPDYRILAESGRREPNGDFGKMLLGLGLLLIVIGAVLVIAARFGLPLGRLPGDVSYRGKNVTCFFPLGTSILISVVLSILLYLISRFRR